MNDEEFQEYLDRKYEEIPRDFLQKCVEVLSEFIPDFDVKTIREEHKKHGVHWIGNEHHFWGMDVRNFLRERGLTDDNLPDGNWDDYYIQVIEKYAGIR